MIGEPIALGDFGVGQAPTIARESESGPDFGVRPLRMKTGNPQTPDPWAARTPSAMLDTTESARSPDLIPQVEFPLKRRPLQDRSNCHYQFPRTLIKVQTFDCFGNHEGRSCTEYSRRINRGDC